MLLLTRMYKLVFKVFIWLVVFNIVSCIRLLKEGPMIDSEGREYKSASLKHVKERHGFPLVGASTVRVKCTDTTMILLINSDLYNNGHHVSPEELFLGFGTEQNGCRAVPVSDTKFIIEAGLEDCGSKVTDGDDSIVYSNKLVYSPVPDNNIITRVISAVIPVACHYPRTHFVSSAIGLPLPPSVSVPPTVKPVILSSVFSLKLMTDDWQRERFSNKYHLGESLHIEASIRGAGQVSKRLYIESCVATLEPDVFSVPRYYFIEDHGCLTDSKEVGSNSRFLSRTRNDKLWLQLDAFKFQQDYRNTIYITCQLKALTTQYTSPQSKACNYANGRWSSVDRNHEVCRCCSNTCNRSPHEQPRNGNPSWISVHASKGSVVCDSVSLIPVIILPEKTKRSK
ncbi:zona pellucida sperm-binding protein 3 [Esox lucius]|uniref:zona pellucida sperm-binding protein 3 n=1 Tax=Esox lucius TaxID=8010 RepID=UPI0014773994|nr:zona pellucida sperm-binding protein 3 [Esox lucius]